MFTGIIEALGTIRDVEDSGTARRFRIEAPDITSELSPGDSVAVDGACLTVADLSATGFAVDVIGTTLGRTVAGTYVDGSVVNLERAMRADGRIDGHFVQGHVDGVGALLETAESGGFWMLDVSLPDEVSAQTVARGSIAINGVSLTVADFLPSGACRIGLIPYTYEHTNLGRLRPGDPVNVEGDLIGKYVGSMLAARAR